MPPQELYSFLKSYIYLNVVIIVDKEAQERYIFNLTAAGESNNYSFDGSEWTKQVTLLKFTNNEIQWHLLGLSDTSHKYRALWNQAQGVLQLSEYVKWGIKIILDSYFIILSSYQNFLFLALMVITFFYFEYGVTQLLIIKLL